MGRCGDAFETAPWHLYFPSQEVRARVLPADFVRGIPGVVSSAGGRDGAGQEGRASQGQHGRLEQHQVVTKVLRRAGSERQR